MQVFVWGETTLQNYNTPMETEIQSLDDVFCVYGNGAMYRAVHIGKSVERGYAMINDYTLHLWKSTGLKYSLESMDSYAACK